MRDLVARPLLARGRIDVTPCLCPRHLEPIRSPQGSCVTFVGTRSRSSGSRSRCKSVSLQADCASLSRACALLVACARPHLVYVCIVFINTSYEEKIPKHGHGEVPVAAAVRLLARGGPCGRCCRAGWLPCIPPSAWPPARAEPNAEPSNTGRRAAVQPGHGTPEGEEYPSIPSGMHVCTTYPLCGILLASCVALLRIPLGIWLASGWHLVGI
jgi:hypothetical protein